MMASCLPTSSLGLFAPQTLAPLPPGCFSSHIHMVLTRSLLETHRVDQWGGVHSEKGQALRQGTWVIEALGRVPSQQAAQPPALPRHANPGAWEPEAVPSSWLALCPAGGGKPS